MKSKFLVNGDDTTDIKSKQVESGRPGWYIWKSWLEYKRNGKRIPGSTLFEVYDAEGGLLDVVETIAGARALIDKQIGR